MTSQGKLAPEGLGRLSRLLLEVKRNHGAVRNDYQMLLGLTLQANLNGGCKSIKRLTSGFFAKDGHIQLSEYLDDCRTEFLFCVEEGTVFAMMLFESLMRFRRQTQ